MQARINKRGRSLLIGAAALGTIVAVALPAYAAIKGDTKKENWGLIDRNTIGSPTAELRDGPTAAIIGSGTITKPPFGKGSLGIVVGSASEKVSYGDQVDFYGQNALDITQIGYYVFQTGEDQDNGGPANLPNISIEMNANTGLPGDDGYTTMVWNPGPLASPPDQWSPYIDATTNGTWYFTGHEGDPMPNGTGCSLSTPCSFNAAMTALNNGGATPVIYTVAIAKGRDNQFQGAVDGLRLNDKMYDFESDGVKNMAAPK